MGLGTGAAGFYPTTTRGSEVRASCVEHFSGEVPTKDMYCHGAKDFQKGQTRLIYSGRLQCAWSPRGQRRCRRACREVEPVRPCSAGTVLGWSAPSGRGLGGLQRSA
eukprot:15020071-Alexandrium_andersonii.AAC.1